MPVHDVEHAWAMLGLTVADLDTAALSQADVDGWRPGWLCGRGWATMPPTASCGSSARRSPGWLRPNRR
ncbi:hypothetical protein I552_0383 [Mycobacterium xenopi 3993]|nr:hypothetical protein I552_0383 [Mycobacterium xenopi 3993]